MSRGLPWSVLLHVIVLALVVLHGNTVQRRVMEPPLLLRARLVSAALLDTPTAQVVAQPEPEAAPPVVEPTPLPPKEVPKAKPEQKKPEPKPKPKEAVRKAEPEAAHRGGRAQRDRRRPGPGRRPARGQRPQHPGHRRRLPLRLVPGQRRGPDRPQLAPAAAGVRRALAGQLRGPLRDRAATGRSRQVTLVQGSSVGVFDREALRAVQSTRLPPLPPQYGGSSLGVTFIFNLESGM